MKIKKSQITFGGETIFATHNSVSTKTEMNFSAFVPGKDRKAKKAIIFLSGLTCTEENFISKAGAQQFLADTETMIICPDTSPRGVNIEGDKDSYDFGEAASFYLNATEPKYSENYQMYDYIVKDMTQICREDFGVSTFGIMGHSMGGHGALMIGLKNPELFESISAFSPIVNPALGPWGQKALAGYLGGDSNNWKEWDSTELIKSGVKCSSEILIDQGLSDEFFEKELLTDNFVKACDKMGQKVKTRYHEGYDHSYYFISTFVSDHIKHHLN